MKKQILLLIALLSIATKIEAQSNTINGLSDNPKTHTWEVNQAFEVESLVPMFFTGGYHFAVCYRYEQFRFRASVINGGTYDAEPAGIKNSSGDFKRHYKTSPGFFFGYNIWKNLEVYTYMEFHTFEIEQKNSGLKKDIHSTDLGAGVSYQFFVSDNLYIQPGLHIYLRGDNSTDFNGIVYNIPNADFAPVLRIGYRLWSKHE